MGTDFFHFGHLGSQARHTTRAQLLCTLRSLRGEPRHTRLQPGTPDMSPPSTSRARASGGGHLGDQSDDGDTLAAEEQSAARDALITAEANMVGMVDRAQDARLSPSMTDMRTVLNDYHAALDRTKSASYAGALVNGAVFPLETARAGAKRTANHSSNTVTRRFTGDGNRAAPAIRDGGASATMTHVAGDALGTFPANLSKKPNVFVLGFVVSPRLSLTPHPRSLRARFSPTFAHSAATRDVRDRAERARVLVKRANDRVANMATGYASTPQGYASTPQRRVLSTTTRLRRSNPASRMVGSTSTTGSVRTTTRGGRG